VSKTFRPYAPRQAFLLPPSPLEWLPDGHLALFILDLVPQLDLSTIYGHYERELRGYPPHDPQMMVALLLYGYCVGVPSSRKIERKTHEDVAFRVIAGGERTRTTRESATSGESISIRWRDCSWRFCACARRPAW
jgi:transposase